MLGRLTAGSSFEQLAALEQRHDGEHTGAGSQLENREQVGEIVAEHIARDGDGVLAAANSLQREFHSVLGFQDLYVKTGKVVIAQVGFYLFDDLSIVAASRIEPEHGGRA